MVSDCLLYNVCEKWNQNNEVQVHDSLLVGDSDNSYLSMKTFWYLQIYLYNVYQSK